MLLSSVHMPVRLAICLHNTRRKGAGSSSRWRGWRERLVCEQHLPKQRSTYRMGPPLSGRAQASSADTSAMGRHLRGAGEGGGGVREVELGGAK